MSEITKRQEGWRLSRSGKWYHPSISRGCVAHRVAECEECGVLFFDRIYKAKGKKGGCGRSFCSKSCSSRATIRDQDLSHLVAYRIQQGAVPHNYKGGTIHSGGYRVVSGQGKKQLEHRFVLEQVLGRALREDEVVHHVNGDKKDNRIENLRLLTQSEHMREHWNEPGFRANWRPRRKEA